MSDAHAVASRGAGSSGSAATVGLGIRAIACSHCLGSWTFTPRQKEKSRDDLQYRDPNSRRCRDHHRLADVGQLQQLETLYQQSLANPDTTGHDDGKITEDV